MTHHAHRVKLLLETNTKEWSGPSECSPASLHKPDSAETLEQPAAGTLRYTAARKQPAQGLTWPVCLCVVVCYISRWLWTTWLSIKGFESDSSCPLVFLNFTKVPGAFSWSRMGNMAGFFFFFWWHWCQRDLLMQGAVALPACSVSWCLLN